MKEIRSGLMALLFLTATAYAQEPAPEGRPPQLTAAPQLDASRIDSTKWCVYAGMLYSPGSVIFVRDQAYVCALVGEMGPTTANLSWSQID